jgi:hypothetical protein
MRSSSLPRGETWPLSYPIMLPLPRSLFISMTRLALSNMPQHQSRSLLPAHGVSRAHHDMLGPSSEQTAKIRERGCKIVCDDLVKIAPCCARCVIPWERVCVIPDDRILHCAMTLALPYGTRAPKLHRSDLAWNGKNQASSEILPNMASTAEVCKDILP